MYEKKISPKNNEIDNKQDNIIEKLNCKISNNVSVKEIKVPDQVLLGLIEGIINGPFRAFPKI